MSPQFPSFKPIELQDRDVIHDILWRYQPRTAEFTFTNLFIWRHYFNAQWSLHDDWLIFLCGSEDAGTYAFEPIGPPSRQDNTLMLLRWLREQRGVDKPRILRADKRLVSELEGTSEVVLEHTRDHFDYVYEHEALVKLPGKDYLKKRNAINKFKRNYSFNYQSMNEEHIEECLELAEAWCGVRQCGDDLSLSGELVVVREALSHFHELKLKGGVIEIDGKIEAFTLGEHLNTETAVVHIEKANFEIPGLYCIMNQQFCEQAWEDMAFINREQDLGEEGLRRAKLSYRPHHLEEKFAISLLGGE